MPTGRETTAFFRRKTDFFVFLKKGGFGGVAGRDVGRAFNIERHGKKEVLDRCHTAKKKVRKWMVFRRGCGKLYKRSKV